MPLIWAAVLIGSSAALMTGDIKAVPTTTAAAESTVGQGQPGAENGRSTMAD